ncbi:TonB-dependent receptor [Novosphingobium terrae]|uniref:TonB-dependent receptor n=1 Tax=Novosphingobium terrae TaxID=2726189 RepID=UPI00197EEA94|nr:TonB-dependent receptor [Novosphingobium terrae]
MAVFQRKNVWLLACAMWPTLAAAQTGSWAGQAPPAAPGAIADIVVTAQKRSESSQNVPIAISAFTADALKENAVSDVAGLSALATNVTLDASTPFSGSTAVLGASIRGIGEADFAFNIDPAVGVYLDGVYLARSIGANQELLDVERIEVLKGPQGTLFGRNTIGGAISIVTHDPGPRMRFTADLTTGSYARLQARGTVDLPITDRLFSSLSFGVLNRQGYQKRIPYPGAVTIDPATSFASAGYGTGDGRQGGDNSFSLRGKLKWLPGPGLKATLSADYTHVDQDAVPNTVLQTTENYPNGVAGAYNACIGLPPAVLTGIGLGPLCGARSGAAGYNALPGLSATSAGRLSWDGRWVNATGNIDTTYASGLNFSQLNQGGAALTLEGDLGPHMRLKSISSLRGMHFAAGTDQSGSPVQLLVLSFTIDQRQLSQELHWSGDLLDGKLTYMLGAYAFRETGRLHDYVNFGEGLLQVDGPGHIATTNYATYGQIDYRPSPLIGLTLGGRFTHEDKSYRGYQTDDNGLTYKLANCAPAAPNAACAAALGFPDPSQPLLYYPATPGSQRFDNFSPKVGVQIHPMADVMFYGSWSRGYETGSWTTRLSAPLKVAPTFGPEHAETFELGLKSSWLGRRLQVNVTGFTTRYRDIQLTFQEGLSPTIQNAGDARINGAELETIAAPARGLTLLAALSYLDAFYTSVLPGAQVAPSILQQGVYAGAALPKAPHWKISLSPRYETPVGQGKLLLQGSFTHTTSMRNDTEGTYTLNRAAADLLNASVTWKAPGGRHEVTLGGTNLTNSRYLVIGGASPTAGLVFGTYNRPAEWYARFGLTF